MKNKVFRKFTLFAACFVLVVKVQGQSFLNTPIEGKYGKDFIIVNYVDWGAGSIMKDAWCGSKTYDGHQGTDFTIRNFKQMDSGVYVLAADSGTVTFIQDGLFDKETDSTISKGLGNYIAIKHANLYYTYYGHLKINSLLVNSGQKVVAGQRIAKVGSSGNSTDPHLHFEVWYDSAILVDPFRGTCGNATSLWKSQIPYDSSFKVWHGGITNVKLDINKHRFEPVFKNEFKATEDSFITVWSLMYGLRKNDTLKTVWTNSTNQIWFQNEVAIDKDYWFYRYWDFIFYPTAQAIGTWNAEVFRNGKPVDKKEFKFPATNNLNKSEVIKSYVFYNNTIHIKDPNTTKIEIYNLSGQLMQSYSCQNKSIDLSSLNSGLYVLKLYNLSGNESSKIFVE